MIGRGSTPGLPSACTKSPPPRQPCPSLPPSPRPPPRCQAALWFWSSPHTCTFKLEDSPLRMESSAQGHWTPQAPVPTLQGCSGIIRGVRHTPDASASIRAVRTGPFGGPMERPRGRDEQSLELRQGCRCRHTGEDGERQAGAKVACSIPGRGTYRNQPMSGEISRTTNQCVSLSAPPPPFLKINE